MNKQKKNWKHLKAVIHIPKVKRKKLDAKGKDVIFVGRRSNQSWVK